MEDLNNFSYNKHLEPYIRKHPLSFQLTRAETTRNNTVVGNNLTTSRQLYLHTLLGTVPKLKRH